MFTGIIERVGVLESINTTAEGGTLVIRHEPWDEPLALGESVSVQGACLTVTSAEPNRFFCDVLDETLRLTNLGKKAAGAGLNLERSLRPSDRFGGHIVSGHVDGMGTVSRLEPVGRDWALTVRCEAELTSGAVLKGSIALDGISLTLTAVTNESLSVHLIPYTWEHTTMGSLKVGDAINIETDMLGKYVRKFLSRGAPEKSVTMDDLRRAGFA